mmetsp:Transcript_17487/g.38100  ORF Transcript_17487/g.38100 Transcript_17487/m.38100 type:complete len:153 (-) Transcript_17487:325-783(-)|eukprot:CAMPEP_0118933108 /NCGR_PEP_ID=MMETSP1169-20130426/11316_1 /TAXON_ID=36882 /ORGANISM="Pyramimonas obovata, Strain CCMP722" /LENGTH=152 /DNA_ID=CAMNT_0006875831 /DNA_START=108 /DNA_END=566 /DNA_ORIENTATION=+
MGRHSWLLLVAAAAFVCAPAFAQDEALPEAQVQAMPGLQIEPQAETLPSADAGTLPAAESKTAVEAEAVEDATDLQMPSNFDLALYGGLTLLVFGVPAAIYKYVFAGDGAAGLSNIVTVERDAARAKVGGTPHARYNTEQLRQTVARLRAQV